MPRPGWMEVGACVFCVLFTLRMKRGAVLLLRGVGMVKFLFFILLVVFNVQVALAATAARITVMAEEWSRYPNFTTVFASAAAAAAEFCTPAPWTVESAYLTNAFVCRNT